MRIAITGSLGQLGSALCQALSPHHQVIPLPDPPDFDITEFASVAMLEGLAPDLIIHTAAMTDVDQCARDPEIALRVNALGTRHMAVAAQRTNAEILYISTNEVFDGAQDEPYLEFDPPHPINAYGRSKWAGERAVQEICSRFYIARTAWLFGASDRPNFITKILERARQDGALSVVTDEIGSPTFVDDLVAALAKLIETHVYGTYHLVNEGGCSRFEYARTLLELTGQAALPLRPISSSQFARPSRPPAQSRLRNFFGADLGITLRPWNEAVAAYLRQAGPAAVGADGTAQGRSA